MAKTTHTDTTYCHIYICVLTLAPKTTALHLPSHNSIPLFAHCNHAYDASLVHFSPQSEKITEELPLFISLAQGNMALTDFQLFTQDTIVSHASCSYHFADTLANFIQLAIAS